MYRHNERHESDGQDCVHRSRGYLIYRKDFYNRGEAQWASPLFPLGGIIFCPNRWLTMLHITLQR